MRINDNSFFLVIDKITNNTDDDDHTMIIEDVDFTILNPKDWHEIVHERSAYHLIFKNNIITSLDHFFACISVNEIDLTE